MSEKFTFADTPLVDLKVVTRNPIGDDRGFLARLFCQETFASQGWTTGINQVNQTRTELVGTVRGMHFQHPPHAEIKLVTCLRGRVWDVAVDIRAGSPTFLQWHGVELSDSNNLSLLIPEGFAHGFQVLESGSELIYLHSAAYAPEAEGALNAEDAALAISWPLSIAAMSDRDRSHPHLDHRFAGVTVDAV